MSGGEPELVFVKGGTFTMGCTSEQVHDCDADEKPAHKVRLNDFYIGKYEVTQAQWKAVMGTNPSDFKGDNLPVERVSWNDVQAFIRKLNERTGKRYRLPTEAEWEYAARGGASSRGYKYSGSNDVGSVAWYNGYPDGKTYSVGSRRANELGIYDMNGNVWEGCQDWFGRYDGRFQFNPGGPSSGSNRVYRGGCWRSSTRYVRVSSRYSGTPASRNNNLGFRLACSSK
jgi:formylglycine-generating enzyme required for sulfatase activity